MPESPQAINVDCPAGVPVIARVLLGLALCVAAAACGGRGMFVPPAGPGTAAPDAAAAWAEATAACPAPQSYAASLRVSGRVGGQRLWPVTIEAAVLADESIYLSATAAGRGLFVLAGTGSRAALWLRREQRIVTAAPADIVEAIVGVRLSPNDLLAVLTGCATRSFDIVHASRQGALISIETKDARIYLERRGGRWQVRAGEMNAFTVEYAAANGSPPLELWLWPSASRGTSASIHLTVSDAQVNGPVPAAVFRMPAGAATATPMTLDELKAGAPWKTPSVESQRSAWPVH
jgi:hypothetical protein